MEGEKYQPSPEEIKKAEETMTDEQKMQSEVRAEEIREAKSELASRGITPESVALREKEYALESREELQRLWEKSGHTGDLIYSGSSVEGILDGHYVCFFESDDERGGRGKIDGYEIVGKLAHELFRKYYDIGVIGLKKLHHEKGVAQEFDRILKNHIEEMQWRKEKERSEKQREEELKKKEEQQLKEGEIKIIAEKLLE